MTTTLTTGYLFPIPPLATGGIADGYGTLLQEADDHVKGDVNTLSGIVTTLSGSLTTTSGYLTTLSGSLTTLSGNVTTLSGTVTTLSGSLTTTSGYLTTLSGAVTTLSGNVATLSGYVTNAWIDYTATSTVTGWSSFTSKIIKYKKVGIVVHVVFYLSGTSNDTVAKFSLPFAVVQDTSVVTYAVDNGGSAVPGLATATGSDANLYKDITGSSLWTGSGTKISVGQFFYEVAP